MRLSNSPSFWLVTTMMCLAIVARGPGEPDTERVFADGPDVPRAIDTSPDGTLWLALTTDTGGGGARQLTADLEPLGGFATLGRTDRVAIDVAGDVMLLEQKERLRGGRSPFLTIHAPDGRHQESWGLNSGAMDVDASNTERSAWMMHMPTVVAPNTTAVPLAVHVERTQWQRAGSIGEDARRIAGAPDGSFYVASDPGSDLKEVRHYDAKGALVEQWTVDYPILAIDVSADGSIWVASTPPMLPDLSKTRIQGFDPGGGMSPGSVFADFEMEIHAIDIAAGRVKDDQGDEQCSVYGVGSFGIGALWTIVRHSCEGEILETLRDIPQVGIWTPVPSATQESFATATSTPTPSSPIPTEFSTATATFPTATLTPSPPAPVAQIYLPMALRLARPGLDPVRLIDEEIDREDWPHDPYEIQDAEVDGDVLRATLRYSGGCEHHEFQLIVSTLFLESFPVRAKAFVTHDDQDDPCDAIVHRRVVFDLEPLRLAFQDAYPSDPGPLLIELDGWDEELRFEMD